ncbi:sulfate permease, partial [Klebsiella pneumoniae]
ILRAGRFISLVPASVIKGMLAAIGILLIMQQIPRALGTAEETGLAEVVQGNAAFSVTAIAVAAGGLLVLAGALQLLFGILRAGRFISLVPASVIKGMLAAIGILLIMQQIP